MHALSPPSVAIHYVADAFDTAKPHLMGRQAAGDAFIRAFIRHAGADTIHLYGHDSGRRHFSQQFGSLLQRGTYVAAIKPAELGRLARVGTLFLADPGVAKAAWIRRPLGNRAYSICGITHTTASHAVMEGIESFCFAPVQAWDALICTSDAVRRTVENVVAETKNYMKSRVGAMPVVDLATPVIPLGVDVDQLTPSATERTKLRDQLGIGPDDILVLFLGRLTSHAKANPLPMFQALQAAAQGAGRRVHLLLAGWFPNEEYRQAFQRGADRYAPDVPYHVLDARRPAQRHAAYSAADFFVSLSDNIQETFGLTPIEAMAAGLPVVVTDWDGYRDTVRNGIDGFVIPTVAAPAGAGRDLAARYATGADSYDLYIGHAAQFTTFEFAECVRALTLLIGDDDRRRGMGNTARQQARAVFDWSVIIGRYQALWQDLAELRERAPETAAVDRTRAARPAWDDPFRAFGHYPTRPWDDRMTVFRGANSESVHELLEHPFAALSRHLLCSKEEMTAILERISRSAEPMPVPTILSEFPRNRIPLARRSLIWMAKFGLVGFGQPSRATVV
jgi:alpha-maltose-1-phosphate synthase